MNERHRTKAGRLLIEDVVSCDIAEFWSHLQTDRAQLLNLRVEDSGEVVVTRIARVRLFGPLEQLPLWQA